MKIAFVAAGFAYSLLPTGTFASNLQPLIASGSVYAQTCFDPFSCGHLPKEIEGSNSSAGSADSSAANHTILSRDPQISATATSDVAAGLGDSEVFSSVAGAQARLEYFVELDGPSNQTVPVLVNALGHTSITEISIAPGNDALAEARFTVFDRNGPIIDTDIESDVGEFVQYAPHEFSVNQYFDFVPNVPYEINMFVKVSTGLSIFRSTYAVGPLTAEATIDPSFTIDPAYSSDYIISFSDGLSSSGMSPVPLPASAPMFGAALLVLGAAGFGMKRKKAAA